MLARERLSYIQDPTGLILRSHVPDVIYDLLNNLFLKMGTSSGEYCSTAPITHLR